MSKHGIFTTTLEELYNWGRKNSVWPLAFGLACCAIEMIATSMARCDLARFGAEVFRPSPRQADLMIVAGTVTKKMAPQVVRLYNQMPEPKYVIAMGACAISGGPFKQGYNVLKGIDRYIPVDVHIPGCPPRPEALMHAFMTLQKKIDEQTPDRRRPRRGILTRMLPSEYPVPEVRRSTIWCRRAIPAVWQPPPSDAPRIANSERRCKRLEADQDRGSKQPCPGAVLEIIPNEQPVRAALAAGWTGSTGWRWRSFCATTRVAAGLRLECDRAWIGRTLVLKEKVKVKTAHRRGGEGSRRDG